MSKSLGLKLEDQGLDRLYHYTSVNAFKSIIDNGSFRMTESDFMNDPIDCKLFANLIEKYEINCEKETDEFINQFKISKIIHRIYDGNHNDKKCSFANYIKYLVDHLDLYVLSFTDKKDDTSMWRAYGTGGICLETSIEDLIDTFRKSIINDNEYLSLSQVIYTDEEDHLENVKVPDLSKIILLDRSKGDYINVLLKHKENIEKTNSWKSAKEFYEKLFSNSNLKLSDFVDAFIIDYIYSLNFLIENNIINENQENDEIFREVFNNASSCNNNMIWKHDLPLILFVFLAVIKNKTYQYEKETRLVYFRYNIDQDNSDESINSDEIGNDDSENEDADNQKRNVTKKFGIKNTNFGEFIYPYVEFNVKDGLPNFLKGVTLSPLTKNIPIDEKMYKRTVVDYLESKGITGVPVEYSKHKMRS